MRSSYTQRSATSIGTAATNTPSERGWGPQHSSGTPQSGRNPTKHRPPVLVSEVAAAPAHFGTCNAAEGAEQVPQPPKRHRALRRAGQLPRDAESILPLPDHKSCGRCSPVLPIDLLLFWHLLLLEQALRALKLPGWSRTVPLPGWMDQDLKARLCARSPGVCSLPKPN